jgi:hypothetical protein
MHQDPYDIAIDKAAGAQPTGAGRSSQPRRTSHRYGARQYLSFSKLDTRVAGQPNAEAVI